MKSHDNGYVDTSMFKAYFVTCTFRRPTFIYTSRNSSLLLLPCFCWYRAWQSCLGCQRSCQARLLMLYSQLQASQIWPVVLTVPPNIYIYIHNIIYHCIIYIYIYKYIYLLHHVCYILSFYLMLYHIILYFNYIFILLNYAILNYIYHIILCFILL